MQVCLPPACTAAADAMHQLGALLMEAYGESKFEEARGLIQAAINARPREGKFRHSLGVALRAGAAGAAAARG